MDGGKVLKRPEKAPTGLKPSPVPPNRGGVWKRTVRRMPLPFPRTLNFQEAPLYDHGHMRNSPPD
jgi:hypothetical protein